MQKRTDNFSKFAEKKKGAAIKEAYRQEKRKNKADARAAGEEMRARKKAKARGEEYIDPKKVTAPPKAGRPVTAAKGPGRPAAGAGRTTSAGSEKPAAGSYKAFKNEKGGSQSNKAGKPVKATYPGNPMDADKKEATTRESLIPLNKYVAHSGVCGRREAAELVKEGKVSVNGDKIFEPGYKVSQADKILVKGKPIFLQRNSVYILLNKPKDYLTTASDPQ